VLANPPRIVAIYPGSFKPPHAGHLRAIEYLLNECGSDQIHIIISSRSRLIPGTAYALDADLARRLFELQLDYAGFPLDKITIEIAEHRAVDQALAYIGHAAKDQTLLFAIGQLDHERNDPR
jgi:nicotinamide mononucleotide adenylyltransferase